MAPGPITSWQTDGETMETGRDFTFGGSETYMQVRKQHLELDMDQQTGSKEEKEYVKTVYCHPAYLMSMQSTL